MNEFGVVDLNEVAVNVVAQGDVSTFQKFLSCNLTSTTLISLILEHKRYDLVPFILDYTLSEGDKKLVYQLYLDLLICGEAKSCELIRSSCSMDIHLLAKLAVKRGIDFLELDCRVPRGHFFSAIIAADNLVLFDKYRDEIKNYSAINVYWDLCHIPATKILEREVRNGHERKVVRSLLQRCISPGTKQELFLISLCNRFDCSIALSEAFDVATDSLMRLQLLLRLGVKPTQEQKEKLLSRNSELYTRLFVEDV